MGCGSSKSAAISITRSKPNVDLQDLSISKKQVEEQYQSLPTVLRSVEDIIIPKSESDSVLHKFNEQDDIELLEPTLSIRKNPSAEQSPVEKGDRKNEGKLELKEQSSSLTIQRLRSHSNLEKDETIDVSKSLPKLDDHHKSENVDLIDGNLILNESSCTQANSQNSYDVALAANVQSQAKEGDKSSTSSDVATSELQFENDANNTGIVPSPSAQITSHAFSTSGVEEFNKYLRKACQQTNNEKLLELANGVTALKLDRSFYNFTKGDLLLRVVSALENLSILNLSGGQVGPIAFRFIANSLKGNNMIKEIDLSDNLANPECSEALGNMISCDSALQVLNVSGNQLGKDALSRYLGAGLLENKHLKSVNLSNCGATDFHCLMESIRNSSSSALKTLILSHNAMSDGHQFAVDVSLVLETACCKLETLNIANTSINPSGVNVITNALSTNTSLRVLAMGGNNVEDLEEIGKLVLYACSHPKMEKFQCNKSNIARADLTEFSECSSVRMKDFVASSLSDLEIASCCLTDNLMKHLAIQLTAKLVNLQFLDISNNNDLGLEGLTAIHAICGGNLSKLKFSLFNQPKELLGVISSFQKVGTIDFTKTRLHSSDIERLLLENLPNLNSLILNGIKLSSGHAFSKFSYTKALSSLTLLHLSGCQLNDEELHPICEALANTAIIFPLKSMDVSVNRLTSNFFSNLVAAMLKHSNHCLQSIDASDNVLSGNCMESLEKLFSTQCHTSSVTSINLSCNDIAASYVSRFFSAFATRRFPLAYLDLSSQRCSFGETDMENLISVMKSVFFHDQSPSKECDFVVNLCGLGGSDITDLRSIDSAAVKTDFVTLRKPNLTLRDLVDVVKGLKYSGDRCESLVSDEERVISAGLWKNILKKDGPAWAVIESELRKAAYISHMPSTVTIQRLQGILEMEADCDVKDVYLVKDPIMLKPTGAAWVLFEDVKSLAGAVEWFCNGQAQMYGTPFIISEIPLGISDQNDDAFAIAQSDIMARDLEMRRQQERDQQILEQSVQLAAERAEYREAHPAYQGGRIS